MVDSKELIIPPFCHAAPGSAKTFSLTNPANASVPTPFMLRLLAIACALGTKYPKFPRYDAAIVSLFASSVGVAAVLAAPSIVFDLGSNVLFVYGVIHFASSNAPVVFPSFSATLLFPLAAYPDAPWIIAEKLNPASESTDATT